MRWTVLLAMIDKDWRYLCRNGSALFTFGIEIVFFSVFIFVAAGSWESVWALQGLYLTPAVIAGSLFMCWMDVEVRIASALHMYMRSVCEFLLVKLVIMVVVTSVLCGLVALLLQMFVLDASGWLFATRLLILFVGCLLQCLLCLVIGSNFGPLEAKFTGEDATASLWLQGLYWLSMIPVLLLLWALELAATASTSAVLSWGISLTEASMWAAALLSIFFIAAILPLLARGAKRIADCS